MAVLTKNGFDFIDQGSFNYELGGATALAAREITLPDLPANSCGVFVLDIALRLRYWQYSSGSLQMDLLDSSGNDFKKNYSVFRAGDGLSDSASQTGFLGGTTSAVPISFPDFDTSVSDWTQTTMEIHTDDRTNSHITFHTHGEMFTSGIEMALYGTIRARNSSDGYSHIKKLSFFPSQCYWNDFRHTLTGTIRTG